MITRNEYDNNKIGIQKKNMITKKNMNTKQNQDYKKMNMITKRAPPPQD